MNRKRLVLAVLVAVLALSLLYAFWAMPRQEQAPPRAATPRPAAKPPAAGKKVPPAADRLYLGMLAEARQPFPGAGRDIFRFRGGQAPAVKIPVVVAPPVEEPPPPPPPTPEQLLQGKVAGFTFLGFLDKGGVKTVFLSSGGDLFLVKAGDRFGKSRDLLAQDITGNQLVVRAVDGEVTVRVQLIENEALKPGSMGTRGDDGSLRRTGSSGVRSGGSALPPRRSILPRRVVPAPQSVEDRSDGGDGQETQPPDDGVKQEEPPNRQVLPGGEGNGKKQ